uniref:Uncharacterized protein n=1 Tax=Glossina morsitans morsitans TaxID=37546 RepID=A0A1B0FPD4_GLOMM
MNGNSGGSGSSGCSGSDGDGWRGSRGGGGCDRVEEDTETDDRKSGKSVHGDRFTWTEKRNHPHYEAAKKAIKHVFKVEPTSMIDSQQAIGLRESLLE